MFSCGGYLSYISIDKDLFTGDSIFVVKFFLGLLMLITIGTLIFFVLKFRILIIKENKLTISNPFILRYKQIELDKIKKTNWSSWEIRGIKYRTLEMTNKNSEKLSITDFEFENFDNLIRKIPNAESTPKKMKIDYEQAKSNISLITFVAVINIVLTSLIVYMNISGKGFHWIHIIFYSIVFSLLYAAQKRRKRYKLILKSK
jgi:hypothetical protein